MNQKTSMAEEQWLACDDTPARMIRHFRDHHAALHTPGLPRKLRLFALNGYQRLWQLVRQQCDQALAGQAEQLVAILERDLEGLASDADRRQEQAISQELWRIAARVQTWDTSNELWGTSAGWLALGFRELEADREDPWAVVFGMLDVGWWAALMGVEPRESYLAARCRVVREMFGNPFQPVTPAPSWLAWKNGTVGKLAQAIHDERAFDRLPILADALEDAGCANQDVLLHCRSGGEHVRGCWLVDLLLGKD